ncbi:MAG: winged helix-turn-helix transcriptional regulator [Methanomicrobiales archaeon]|nr:winged helix-turn-helix transcriptional regulator [Methanomicrobiales archaeon]
MHQRLTLHQIPRPLKNELTNEIYWLCDTLGLSAGRDLDNLATQIVLTILSRSEGSGISSDELSNLLAISSSRVNHHLRNLTRSGIIYRERRLVHLRRKSLSDSIREIRRDADRIFDELEQVAEEIDKLVGVTSQNGKKALIIRDSMGIVPRA